MHACPLMEVKFSKETLQSSGGKPSICFLHPNVHFWGYHHLYFPQGSAFLPCPHKKKTKTTAVFFPDTPNNTYLCCIFTVMMSLLVTAACAQCEFSLGGLHAMMWSSCRRVIVSKSWVIFSGSVPACTAEHECHLRRPYALDMLKLIWQYPTAACTSGQR